MLFSVMYHYSCNRNDFYSSIKLKDDSCGVQPMQNWYDSIYFSTIVQSTVGYGDISPKTSVAKLLVISQVMSSFIILII